MLQKLIFDSQYFNSPGEITRENHKISFFSGSSKKRQNRRSILREPQHPISVQADCVPGAFVQYHVIPMAELRLRFIEVRENVRGLKIFVYYIKSESTFNKA